LYNLIPSGIAFHEAIHAIFEHGRAAPNLVAADFARAGKFVKG